MKIYTRTGDQGLTSVIGGGRLPKDDARIEAYGTVDELGAFVGQAAAWMAAQGPGIWADMLERLTQIQQELFDCGSDLSYAVPVPEKMKVKPEMTERLERWIDEYAREASPVQRFILSGGSQPAALLHVCRTVCRRAERRVVTLGASGHCPEEVLKYLNRLSDFFFAAARAANARMNVPDTEYERGAEVFGRKSNP